MNEDERAKWIKEYQEKLARIKETLRVSLPGKAVTINGKTEKIVEVDVDKGLIDDYGISIVPVKFESGIYSFIDCGKSEIRAFGTTKSYLHDAIRHSTAMPEIGFGIGSDVFHIRGKNKFGPFFGKKYFNEKATWRDDEFHQEYTGWLGIVLELEGSVSEEMRDIARNLPGNLVAFNENFRPYVYLYDAELEAVRYMGMDWRLRQIAKFCSGLVLQFRQFEECGNPDLGQRWLYWTAERQERLNEPRKIALEFQYFHKDKDKPWFREVSESDVYRPEILIGYSTDGLLQHLSKGGHNAGGKIIAVHFARIGKFSMVEEVIHTEKVEG